MTEPLRVALATSRSLPDWEVDDRPFFAALERRGVDVAHPAWDDAWTDWSAFDLCVIRTTWDYQERADDFLAWAERVSAVTRLANPLHVVRWNVDKRYLRELEDAGTACVPTEWLERGADVDLGELLRARGWRRAFVKPVVGANARATHRFDDSPDALRAAQTEVAALLARESLMLQPYLSRVEDHGEVSLVFFDGEFSHGVRKVPKPGDYRVQDDWGATDEPWEPGAERLEEGRRILRRVEACCSPSEPLLYARLDFLLDDEGRLALNEAELIEPSLFFRHGPHAADRLAAAVCERVLT